MSATRKPLDVEALQEQINIAKRDLRSRGILASTFTVDEGYCVRLIARIGKRRVCVERLVPFGGRTDKDLMLLVKRALNEADVTVVRLSKAADSACEGR